VLCKSDTLRKIIARIEAGDMMVQELCEFGDKLLTDETAKVFKKEKDMKKGQHGKLVKLQSIIAADYSYKHEHVHFPHRGR